MIVWPLAIYACMAKALRLFLVSVENLKRPEVGPVFRKKIFLVEGNKVLLGFTV